METKGKQRVDTFDIMKFIGIILVIVGHMTGYFREFIFSFHMPLFFIIAGYFYRTRNISENFRLDVKHLVYPYLLTAVAIFSTYALCSTFKDNISLVHWFAAMCYGSGSTEHTSPILAHVPAIGAIWFLLALFWCKNIFNIIIHKLRYWYVASIIVSLLAIAIDRYLINLPWAILPGAGAVMFYATGCYIKRQGGFLKINPILASLCILVWIVSFLRYGLIGMVICSYPNFIINVIGALGGTYALFLISETLSTCRFPMRKIVIWGGQNSMTFLCIHLYDLDVPIRGVLHIPNKLGIPLVIVACFVGTYILSKIPFTRKVYNIKPHNFSSNDQ